MVLGGNVLADNVLGGGGVAVSKDIALDALEEDYKAGTTGYTWLHTLAADVSAIYIGIMADYSTAFTWAKVGSTLCTKIIQDASSPAVCIWRLSKPPIGAQTLSFLNGQGRAVRVWSVSLINVNTTLPEYDSKAVVGSTLDIDALEGGFLLDAVGDNATPGGDGFGNVITRGYSGAGSYMALCEAKAYTTLWTGSLQQLVAVSVRPS